MRVSNLLPCMGALVLLFSVGCASHVAERMGDAHEANRQSMIANADAGMEPTDGVVEFEGSTVENTMSRYRKTQSKQPSKTLPSSILSQAMSSKAK